MYYGNNVQLEIFINFLHLLSLAKFFICELFVLCIEDTVTFTALAKFIPQMIISAIRR